MAEPNNDAASSASPIIGASGSAAGDAVDTTLEGIFAAMAKNLERNNEAFARLSKALEERNDGGDKMFDRFSSHKPLEYHGEVDPVELES